MDQNKVLKFAQRFGYDGAQHRGTWQHYEVFEPTFEDTDASDIGKPAFILVFEDIIRMATEDEVFEYIDSLPDDEEEEGTTAKSIGGGFGIEPASTRYDEIVEVEKFNPYHDSKGRFASANSYTSFTYKPGKSKAHDLAIQREKDRYASAGAGGGGNTKTQTEHDETVYEEYGDKVGAIMKSTGVSEKEAESMVDSIEKYTGWSYKSIRSYQTDGPPPDMKKESDDLEKFIEKSPKWAGSEVYRGLNVDDNTAADIVNNAKSGKLIGQRGVSSWTTDREVTDAFVVGSESNKIIFISKGTQNGTSVKHLSEFDNENEVMMSSKARWKPTKVTQVDSNTWEIECDPV